MYLFPTVLEVSFAEDFLSVREGAGLLELMLVKEGEAVGPVSVRLTTQDGTATRQYILCVCVCVCVCAFITTVGAMYIPGAFDHCTIVYEVVFRFSGGW